MPLYEFRCPECGVFDQWRSLDERNLPAECPTCQQPAQRIFSPPAILSGSLRLKQEAKEPKLIQRTEERSPPRVKNHTGGRPWMISH
ncbi:zinc ribbon domain-containing protein [Thermoleptolyngbya sichuanensis A183]|uniref:Zinc ribbon domain-containing protein n=1 Tax=Thermoleptolyngbya sichuanensis A183 TaxID=2737172 RepID=A0A6M8BCR5_9CYAN|nr:MULTISPECIES: zinc ribbon domain-containing protein [Thermoleptolyngbya]QKD84634.1 zinc ribbon domain-containing protein [Thermoleptolyngbya sichuanensis A183]